MIVDITNCPRCGGDHNRLVFRPFKSQNNEGWSHWSQCPAHGDPILIQFGGGSRAPQPGVLTITQTDPVMLMQETLDQKDKDPNVVLFEARELIKGMTQ